MKSITPRNRPNHQKSSNRSHSPQIVVKTRNKQNVPPAQKTNKPSNHEQQSLKICLELASHHKKEAQELKRKNEDLECRLKEQVNDMQSLKKELEGIKTSLHQNQVIKKENEALKQENAQLRAKIEEITRENTTLKVKSHEIESIITVGQSASMTEINPLTLAKQSRRQKYAQDYESISFVPSAVCILCQQKESQLTEERQRYCNELRQLQEQVSELQRIEIMVGVMEQQLSDKNVCIDYLRGELESFEGYSRSTLECINVLEQRLNDINQENYKLKDTMMRHSFSKTVA